MKRNGSSGTFLGWRPGFTWSRIVIGLVLIVGGLAGGPAAAEPEDTSSNTEDTSSNITERRTQQFVRGGTFYHRTRNADGTWTNDGEFEPLPDDADVYTETLPEDPNIYSWHFKAFNAYFFDNGKKIQQVVRGDVIYERKTGLFSGSYGPFQPVEDPDIDNLVAEESESITGYNWFANPQGSERPIKEQVIVTETKDAIWDPDPRCESGWDYDSEGLVLRCVRSTLWERGLHDSGEPALNADGDYRFYPHPDPDFYQDNGYGSITALNTMWVTVLEEVDDGDFISKFVPRQQIYRKGATDFHFRDGEIVNGEVEWGGWKTTGAAIIRTGEGPIAGFNSRVFPE